jgi:hypothetical protein
MTAVHIIKSIMTISFKVNRGSAIKQTTGYYYRVVSLSLQELQRAVRANQMEGKTKAWTAKGMLDEYTQE